MNMSTESILVIRRGSSSPLAIIRFRGTGFGLIGDLVVGIAGARGSLGCSRAWAFRGTGIIRKSSSAARSSCAGRLIRRAWQGLALDAASRRRD
jgi:hypothetical protein